MGEARVPWGVDSGVGESGKHWVLASQIRPLARDRRCQYPSTLEG